MVEKKTGLDWMLDILNTALLILIGLACLYPFWYVVCASFSDANEFLRHDFVLLLKPLKFSLEAYQYCITDRILVGYRNTLFDVVAGTAISMFLTFLGAYALSQATIAVVLLFYAVSRWNDWMSATIFLRTADLYPLQIFLREILLTSSADNIISTSGGSTNTVALAETIKYATIVISTAPILCIYPFIQRYFVTGVMIGGVKE